MEVRKCLQRNNCKTKNNKCVQYIYNTALIIYNIAFKAIVSANKVDEQVLGWDLILVDSP